MYFDESREQYYHIDQSVISNVITKVFLWMFLGLLVTGFVAYSIATNPNAVMAVSNFIYPILFLGLGVGLAFNFMINKISSLTAKVLFLVYAAIQGLFFSIVLLVTDPASFLFTLGLTTVIFAVMATYGYVTKNDLTKLGSLFMIGLIVLIIASVFNMFFQLPMLYWVITYMGTAIFIGLIAFDINRIKNQLIYMSSGNSEVLEKMEIFGAFQLYLDFINLLLYLLRIFGRKRD